MRKSQDQDQENTTLNLICLARSHLLVHMSSVLLYEHCESEVIRSQLTETIQDTRLTRVKEWDVLGHLHSEQRDPFV